MNIFNVFTAILGNKDIKVTDKDRKQMMIYLIDTMDKPSTLIEVKKILDAVVVYEKS